MGARGRGGGVVHAREVRPVVEAVLRRPVRVGGVEHLTVDLDFEDLGGGVAGELDARQWLAAALRALLAAAEAHRDSVPAPAGAEAVAPPGVDAGAPVVGPAAALGIRAGAYCPFADAGELAPGGFEREHGDGDRDAVEELRVGLRVGAAEGDEVFAADPGLAWPHDGAGRGGGNVDAGGDDEELAGDRGAGVGGSFGFVVVLAGVRWYAELA